MGPEGELNVLFLVISPQCFILYQQQHDAGTIALAKTNIAALELFCMWEKTNFDPFQPATSCILLSHPYINPRYLTRTKNPCCSVFNLVVGQTKASKQSVGAFVLADGGGNKISVQKSMVWNELRRPEFYLGRRRGGVD